MDISIFILCWIALYCISYFIGIFKIDNKKIFKYIYILLIILLICLATLLDKTYLPDYLYYVDYLFSDNLFLRIEPAFLLIKKVCVLMLKDEYVLFFIYIVLGVTLKSIAIRKLSSLVFLSIAAYISSFYVYHELIQIRAGVASGFFLLSLKPLYERDKLKFFIFVIAATLFHYSAIISLFLWFIPTNNKYNSIYLYMIPVAMLLYVLNMDAVSILENISFGVFRDKILGYKNIAMYGGDRGMYSSYEYSSIIFCNWNIFRVLYVYYIWLFCRRISYYNKYVFLLLKINTIGLSLIWLTGSIPVVSMRLSEFLTSSSVILIPLSVYTLKNRIISSSIVLFYGLYWMLWIYNNFLIF